MIKAKKILGVTLAAAALAATMSMGAAAESSVVVNLMPTDVNSISCDRGGGTVEMNGSSVVFKAGAEESHFTYPVTMQVDMTVTVTLLRHGIHRRVGYQVEVHCS